MTDQKIKSIAVFAPGRGFLRPYFEREFGEDITVRFFTEPDENEIATADYAVMVSSTDIYGKSCQPERFASPDWEHLESSFMEHTNREGISHVILRCPLVVATGMDGWPLDIARRITRGTYFHVEGLDGSLSVVHGCDIAAASHQLAQAHVSEKCFDICDGCNPTLHDFAEALAYRIGDRRIGVLKPLLGKLLYGKSFFRFVESMPVFSCDALIAECGFRPTSVTEYLRTHVYDENSL